MTIPRRIRPNRRTRVVSIALYTNAALLAAILMAILTRDGRSISLLPAAHATDGPAVGGGGNLYVIPGQFSERRYGCYLMDTDAQTLCVYQFDGAGSKLKLIAARNFRHDRRMGHLNTEPDPKEVEVMVEAERAGGRGGKSQGDDAGESKSRGNSN